MQNGKQEGHIYAEPSLLYIFDVDVVFGMGVVIKMGHLQNSQLAKQPRNGIRDNYRVSILMLTFLAQSYVNYVRYKSFL